LSPNTTGSSIITVENRENIPVGIDYQISVSVGDGNRISHFAVKQTNMFVQCPPPRPVSHIVANPIIPFYSFGLQAGPVFLSWEACGYGLWCCCPCKYRIERNGEIIGESDFTNFTDSSRLKVGVRYVYTITTIDRNGIESSPFVCDNTIAVEIEPISLKNLFVFMSIAISCMIALAFLVYVIFYLARKIESVRNRRQGREYEDVYFLPESLTRFLKVVFFQYFQKTKETIVRIEGYFGR